jgi:hypothetical protein
VHKLGKQAVSTVRLSRSSKGQTPLRQPLQQYRVVCAAALPLPLTAPPCWLCSQQILVQHPLADPMTVQMLLSTRRQRQQERGLLQLLQSQQRHQQHHQQQQLGRQLGRQEAQLLHRWSQQHKEGHSRLHTHQQARPLLRTN